MSICPKTSRAFTLTGSSPDAGEPQELEEALPLDIDAGALEAQTGGEAVSGIKWLSITKYSTSSTFILISTNYSLYQEIHYDNGPATVYNKPPRPPPNSSVPPVTSRGPGRIQRDKKSASSSDLVSYDDRKLV